MWIVATVLISKMGMRADSGYRDVSALLCVPLEPIENCGPANSENNSKLIEWKINPLVFHISCIINNLKMKNSFISRGFVNTFENLMDAEYS